MTDFIRSGDDLLSHILRCSTIGMIALNFRVRDGIGCFTNTMITGPVKVCQTSVLFKEYTVGVVWSSERVLLFPDGSSQSGD